MYSLQGQYEKAAEITRQEVRLEGESFSNSSLVNYALALERFDEAQKMINEAQMGKAGDNLVVHAALYARLSQGGFRGDGGTAKVVCR